MKIFKISVKKHLKSIICFLAIVIAMAILLFFLHNENILLKLQNENNLLKMHNENSHLKLENAKLSQVVDKFY